MRTRIIETDDRLVISRKITAVGDIRVAKIECIYAEYTACKCRCGPEIIDNPMKYRCITIGRIYRCIYKLYLVAFNKSTNTRASFVANDIDVSVWRALGGAP